MKLSRREWLAGASVAAGAAPNPPNVVVVLGDDLGYGDVGCYNPEARTRTPHLDRVARQGVRFTDAHSPSSVCTPTRYGLLTGRYCWRTKLKSGVLNGYSPALIENGRETLASLLKKRGYRSGGFGKWHLGLGAAEKTGYTGELRPAPNDYGFDEYFGIPASLDMPPYVYFENRRCVEPPTATIADNGAPPRGPFWRGGPIAPSFRMEEVLPKITERACRFIEESRRGPFFCYVPLNAPHTPWVPVQSRLKTSRAGLYGDFVEQVDDSLGRILDQLDRSGAAENTLLVVTSDNGAPWSEPDFEPAGGHRANAAWRGQKADIQEAGHRVPFLVRFPGRARPGLTSAETICLTDIFHTAAAAAGATLQPGMGEDSFDFTPALAGQPARPVREAIVHHSAQGLFAIRQGNWKLILGRGSGGFTAPARVEPKPGEPAGELYDLAADPHEDRNLYAQRGEVVARLTALLQRYQREGRSRPA